jgi:hypothetical protein
MLRLKYRKMLPVVLYGCETWFLTLREEQIGENRVIRRIFCSNIDGIVEAWRKLYK